MPYASAARDSREYREIARLYFSSVLELEMQKTDEMLTVTSDELFEVRSVFRCVPGLITSVNAEACCAEASGARLAVLASAVPRTDLGV